jgi:N-acetylmuramic acid 6-phosphate etherase
MSKQTTEQDSEYNDLEQKSVTEILENINKEDQSVPKSVEKVISKIETLVNAIVAKMATGGRLF